jgi:hypothetical protein
MNGWRAWHKVSGLLVSLKDQSVAPPSSSYDSHDSFWRAYRRQIGNRISLKLDLGIFRLLRQEAMLQTYRFIPLIFLVLPDRIFAILGRSQVSANSCQPFI